MNWNVCLARKRVREVWRPLIEILLGPASAGKHSYPPFSTVLYRSHVFTAFFFFNWIAHRLTMGQFSNKERKLEAGLHLHWWGENKCKCISVSNQLARYNHLRSTQSPMNSVNMFFLCWSANTEEAGTIWQKRGIWSLLLSLPLVLKAL